MKKIFGVILLILALCLVVTLGSFLKYSDTDENETIQMDPVTETELPKPEKTESESDSSTETDPLLGQMHSFGDVTVYVTSDAMDDGNWTEYY